MTTRKEKAARQPPPPLPDDEGPVGIVTTHTYISNHIARIEGSLSALQDLDLSLIEIERLERALVKGHAYALLTLDRLDHDDDEYEEAV